MPILTEVYNSLARQADEKRKSIQEKRKTNVVCIFSDIHRGLVTSLSATLKNLEQTNKSHYDTLVILHSGGGDADAAYHLGVMLSSFTKGQLNFVVPRWAKSAATLLALSGDNILMFDSAELGPLDPQILRKGKLPFSALALKAMLNLLKEESKAGNTQTVEILASKLDPLDLGEVDRTLGISEKYATSLLVKRMFKEMKEDDPKLIEIASTLTKKYPHHGYLIEFNEAQRIGLKVSQPDTELTKDIQEIYDLEARILELSDIDRRLQEYAFIKQRGL